MKFILIIIGIIFTGASAFSNVPPSELLSNMKNGKKSHKLINVALETNENLKLITLKLEDILHYGYLTVSDGLSVRICFLQNTDRQGTPLSFVKVLLKPGKRYHTIDKSVWQHRIATQQEHKENVYTSVINGETVSRSKVCFDLLHHHAILFQMNAASNFPMSEVLEIEIRRNEAHANKAMRFCDRGHLCGNGKCIAETKTCDKVDDCQDGGSDEVDCQGFNSQESLKTFYEKKKKLCHSNKKCMSSFLKSTYLKQLYESKKTEKVIPATSTCRPPTYFPCYIYSNSRCILDYLRCNGVDNCGNNADEINCNSYCTSSEYRCRNGRCIPRSYVCDGDNDCGDNSDERNCHRTTPRSGCGSSLQWRCRNGRCISASYRCDGDNDCGDNSDEENCPSCRIGYWRCRNNRCIRTSWKCDGTDDCGDNSDEENCLTVTYTGTYIGASVGSFFTFFIIIICCVSIAQSSRAATYRRTRAVAARGAIVNAIQVSNTPVTGVVQTPPTYEQVVNNGAGTPAGAAGISNPYGGLPPSYSDATKIVHLPPAQ